MEERDLVTRAGRFRALIFEPPTPPPDASADPGARPSVILYLHGFPDHPPTARPFLEHLARAGYQVVAPWLRGYHPSVLHGPYTQERLVEDTLAMADLVSPEAPIYIIGHDWGAAIAYPAMAQAPDRFAAAVTLAVPHPLAVLRAFGRDLQQLRMSWYMFFFQLPWLPERLVPARDMAFIDRLWRDWSPDYTLPAPERRALHQCLRASMPAPIQYYRAALRPGPIIERERRHARGERVTVPTLHLHGARDGCIRAALGRDQGDFFAAPFETHTLPELGHFLPQEAPTLVAEHALDWFQHVS